MLITNSQVHYTTKPATKIQHPGRAATQLNEV